MTLSKNLSPLAGLLSCIGLLMLASCATTPASTTESVGGEVGLAVQRDMVTILSNKLEALKPLCFIFRPGKGDCELLCGPLPRHLADGQRRTLRPV